MTRTKKPMKKSAAKQLLVKAGKLHTPMPAEKLAPREREVIMLTAYGKTRSEIAQIISVTEETVKTYLHQARIKLHAVNKAHAVTIAITLGLIAPYYKKKPCGSLRRSKKMTQVPQTGDAQGRMSYALCAPNSKKPPVK